MAKQMDLDATPVWERGMNPEQLAAIRHQDGPCALLAQAGSGKTRALVHRIARMVAQGTRAEKILAVTFSKKAAMEMNERLEQLGVEDARVGTWHSLCLQILKEDGVCEGWTMGDEADSKSKMILKKDVLGYEGMGWKEADLGEVTRYIGWCKAHLARPGSNFARDHAEEAGGGDQSLFLEAYARYQALLERREILTYDDFLLYAHEHLVVETNRAKWAARWRYLLQDEAQDANLAQVEIAKLLARDHRNYLVVGDVAQAIYGFRGSSPLYLHGFAEQWGAQTIVMNRNYRSGSKIVDAANRVIAPAAVRLPTDMLCERGVEGDVRVQECFDLDDEGEGIACWVERLLQDGVKLSDVCVLYRTNAQSRAPEEALLNKRIPYEVVGGTSFYERKEVKDLLAYLRVAADRDQDGDAARRCVNAPFRYLGARFLDKLEAAQGETLRQRVQGACQAAGIQSRQVASVHQWLGIVEQLTVKIAAGIGPEELLNHVLDRTGYMEWIQREHGEESVEDSRGSNVREMVRIAGRFEAAGELLNYIDEMQQAGRRKHRGDAAEKVKLMSVHRSKGLEWKHVWVCGCNDLVLPHGKGDLEEERRLMYVAVTRARDGLVLSYVKKFAYRAGVKDAFPSPFLADAGLIAAAAE